MNENSIFNPWFYRMCRFIVFVCFKLFLRLKVIDAKNVPKEGGVILAGNHRSFADPPLIGVSVKRDVHFLAKQELFEFGPFGWLISHLNAHPLNRSGDVAAFKLAVRLLKKGYPMIVFPEGRRVREGQTVRAKPGVGLLAKMTGSKVIPVYIHNSSQSSKLGKVIVQFGKPLDPADFDDAQDIADTVMERIQKMKDQMISSKKWYSSATSESSPPIGPANLTRFES